MNSFATPDWESNPVADKTCNEVFKGRKTFNQKNKKKKGNNNKKPEIKAGRIEKVKTKQKKSKSNSKNAQTINAIRDFGTKKINSNDGNKPKGESIKNNVKNKQFKKQLQDVPYKSKHVQQESGNNHMKQQMIRENVNNRIKTQNVEESENRIKTQKPKVTHQTLFNQTSRRKRPKTNERQLYATTNLPALKERIASKKKLKRLKKKQYKANQKELETSESQGGDEDNYETNESNKLINKNSTKGKQKQTFKEKLQATLEESKSLLTTLTKKQKSALPLRERMMEKLKGARFRYLNEQMYTSEGKDAKKYFEGDKEAYEAYHEGYKQQVARWPLNPLDVIIEKIKKLPKTHVVADFGCGEAKLAKSVQQMVHSFDLVAVDEWVTACDMAHVPLPDNSVNVVVFCLSLMGTNLKDYLLEAHRVLKVGGLLKIAEVESRFNNVEDFIRNVQNFGFTKITKDLSHDMFCFLDFVKKEANVKQKKKFPDVSLNPCLYKKR